MARWMKVDEARQYSGGVSRKTIYRAVAAGRNYIFCYVWIDAWL